MDHASDFVYMHHLSDSSGSEGEESFSDDEMEDGLLDAVIEADEGESKTAGEGAGAPPLAPGGVSAPAAAATPATGLFGGIRARLSSMTGAGPASASAAAPRRKAVSQKAKRMERRAAGRRGKYRRRIDTNVLSLSLSRLAEDVDPATGDVVFCKTCQAALSNMSVVLDAEGKRVRHPSDTTSEEPAAAGTAAAAAAEAPADADAEAKVTEAAAEGAGEGAGAGAGAGEGASAAAGTEGKAAEEDEGDQTWKCEFCGTVNKITLDAEEIPASASLDYVLEPPPPSALGRSSTGDDNMVIFCIDISGSMCVTQEVEGRVTLKGDKRSDMAHLAGRGDGDQFMPGQRRDVTYVSRLQCVQAAVTAQIETLKKDFPSRKVGVVTFNSDVTIIGDGTSDAKVLTGDRLSDYATLVTSGTEYPLDGKVLDTGDTLITKITELEETGPTALGPAVVVATSMAARKAGSKVVVCTDGLANVGLGAMDELEGKSDEERKAVEAFYERVGAFAASKGVTIDVVGIEGEGCDLETLGGMAEAAGGAVEKVAPAELTTNFATMLANPVVATNVQVTVLLHNGLQFQNEAGVSGNKLVRDIGNVTSESDVTFEYAMKSKVILKRDGINLTGLKSLPFQVQIKFTKLDQMKCVRVLSQAKPITRERAQAEATMATPVLATHAAQQSASMAKAGDYTTARVNARAWSNMMARNVRSESQRQTLASYVTSVEALDDVLRTEVAEERSMGLRMEDAAGAASVDAVAARKTRRHKKDMLSKVMHKTKKAGKSSYSSSHK